MTPNDTTKLLTYIAGLDARMNARDDQDARARVASWSRLLCDADYQVAMTTVERYYRDPQNTYPITVNVIAGACRPAPKWEERPALTAAIGQPMPDSVKALIIGRDTPDHAARKVRCPWPPCRAAVGQACNLPSRKPHPARIDAAGQERQEVNA